MGLISSNIHTRCIVHIDADAFFAAVEQKDNPELRGKPVIIGHDPTSRGVVSTCSYEARAFGVRSAMPVSHAYRLCPHGVFVKPRMKRYQEISQAMFDIFDRYSPLIEELSIDEAFIDATGENGVKMACRIKKAVRQELGITVTAGVSYCKYLAKIASDMAKPDGLKEISPGEAYEFLSDLPVSRLPGIGPKTGAKLVSMGIASVGVLRQMPKNWFVEVLGKRGLRVLDLCNGIDHDPITPSREAKSISEETTFAQDIAGRNTLRLHLAALSQNVAFKLRKSGLKCKTVGIKLRFEDFSTITREHTVPEPISSDPDMFKETSALLDAVSSPKAVRLLGVTARGLLSGHRVQPSLFTGNISSWDVVSQSIDDLRVKYGKPVLFLGASLQPRCPKQK